MKQKFTENLRLGPANRERLVTVNRIIAEYVEQGYRLTLRQLYYQLVSRDIIPNKQSEYKKLGTLLVKGRMGGVVDWEAIEDRIRIPYIPYWVRGVPDALKDTISHYRLDRMKDQDQYIEVWVEKDALSGVLRPITAQYHINLMVNRGYSSCSAMYDAWGRFRMAHSKGKGLTILYIGDHDPSGLDMVRDISERLLEFGVRVDVNNIALTMAQIEEHNPPPNPAKVTDPRAGDYIDQFGEMSWEVDALNPATLNTLLTKEIESLIDMDIYNDCLTREEADKGRIGAIINDLE